jgi:DNA-binding NarL/FixJ family response regulator
MQEVHILMVDDHPAILSGYDVILKMNTLNVIVNTTLCYSIEDTLKYVNTDNLSKFDFIFLDKSMPAYHEKGLYSGIDLAKLILNRRKKTKIAILTSHAEPLILSQIKNEINPIAILTKSDIDFFEMQKVLALLMENKKYYSDTVINALATLDKYRFELDHTDQQILRHLSEGVMTKNLPNYIDLSLDTINKRKAKIKTIFKLNNGKDQDLIKMARDLGLLS